MLAAPAAAADALRSEEGDVLCFLPGVGEIRNTQRRLQELLPAGAQRSVRVLPLHGNLSAQQQDQAIRCGACWALPYVLLLLHCCVVTDVDIAQASRCVILSASHLQVKPRPSKAKSSRAAAALLLPCCRRDPEGLRRVILATPIAESSLTIDSVRIVVDAGYRRAPLYDLATGISRWAGCGRVRGVSAAWHTYGACAGHRKLHAWCCGP